MEQSLVEISEVCFKRKASSLTGGSTTLNVLVVIGIGF
jgi:hypothetical protein